MDSAHLDTVQVGLQQTLDQLLVTQRVETVGWLASRYLFGPEAWRAFLRELNYQQLVALQEEAGRLLREAS
jgi:hypothetical protein